MGIVTTEGYRNTRVFLIQWRLVSVADTAISTVAGLANVMPETVVVNEGESLSSGRLCITIILHVG